MNKDTFNPPIIESLEPRLFLSAVSLESVVGDFANTLWTANEISVQADEVTTVEGEISSPRDFDFVKFVAPLTGGLSVTMDGEGGLDAVLLAYNANPRLVVANNNMAVGTLDARVNMFVQAGQTYYLFARSAWYTAGEYELSLVFSEDEDGAGWGNATALNVASEATTVHSSSIDYSRDQDMFTFVAPDNGAMTVTMSGDASGVDSLLFVYNAAGRYVTANNNYQYGSRDAQTSFIVQAGQSYYVLAAGMYASAGQYDLTFTHKVDEHGNIPALATAVALGEGTTDVSGGIDYRYDRDYFQFTAAQTGGMTIHMDAAAGSYLDSMLLVQNAAGRYITWNDDVAPGQTNSAVNFYVQAGQTYYVQARGWWVSQGDYDLHFTFSPDQQGNTPAGAQFVTLDEDGDAVIDSSLEYGYDVDWFVFAAEQNTDMSIRMHDVDPSIRPYLSIWNDLGQRVTYGVGYYGGSTAASFRVAAGRTYYVRAASLSPGRGDYTLSFDMRVDDHGNDRAGATQLTVVPGTPTAVSGVIDYAYDLDFFVFTAAQSGGMDVTMEASAGSRLDTYLTIRNAAGTVVASNDDSGGTLNSAVSFYVEAGRTYYVQAHAYSYSQGAYNLELMLTGDDYGGSFATAGTLALDANGAGVLTGAINFEGDNDYVAFFATHTGDMSLSLARTSGTLRPTLAIYNSSGQLLTTGVGTGSVPASVTFSSVQGAKYYARLYAAATSETGGYRLTAQTSVPDPDPDPDPNPDIPDPTPGSIVTAVVYNTGSGLLLRIVGTNNNDVIVVSQTASSVSVTGSLAYSYNGVISSIELYGFAGNDVLRTTYSVTAVARIYSGDGNDTIYENGQGHGYSYGEAGDDLIVSVGGGQDTVAGGAGTDSFWMDSTDALSDASSVETAAKSVHRITSFYQPYTTNPASSDYVSLEIAGQNYRDPTLTSYASGYANFSHLAVFNNGPQYDDINQGSVGDCYFLAAVSSLSQTDPTIIQQMITALGDGTYAVRFYSGSTEVYLRIDGDLPVNSSGNLVYARTSDTSEIWVPLIEKAYCHFRYGQDSYASISGGWMDDVYREVTGVSATFQYTYNYSTSTLATYLRNNLNAGHAVTLGSYSSAASPVVGGHAYQVVSIDASNYVTVYNPWGVDGRTWDSNYNDGLLRLSISQVLSNYVGICVSLA
ncbi:MAG: hypothetical protein JW849_07340 [Phycisphaerae bacterium]|nr:hypothetical protein [Phycisphaerae bacterium]